MTDGPSTVDLHAALAATSDLRGRSFLRELDFTPAQWQSLVALSAALKAARAAGTEPKLLSDKVIALIFEKTSTRTRCAFEVAAYHQGAHVTYLGPESSQIGHKESIADTARVLGRFYDGIEYRGAEQDTVDTLARLSGVPVFNGLTDLWHPTQALCDALTMLEHAGPQSRLGKAQADIAFAYVGDARFNTGNSLLVLGALMGMDVRIGAPTALQPDSLIVKWAREVAEETGARITITDDPYAAVQGVDFIHTDVWVSMGEPKEVWAERIALLSAYQVNRELLSATGNPDVLVMHCLPAFHDLDTAVGRQVNDEFGLKEIEITNDVFESEASIVFDQAENRLHTIKAVLVAALANT